MNVGRLDFVSKKSLDARKSLRLSICALAVKFRLRQSKNEVLASKISNDFRRDCNVGRISNDIGRLSFNVRRFIDVKCSSSGIVSIQTGLDPDPKSSDGPGR
jgi:hypothetical protein